MTEWAQKNTMQCEVVKIAMAQDKNGHILKLSIHPNDLPSDLVLDPLGSRYVMVLARLNDQDGVEPPKEKSDGEKAVSIAGKLCSNDRFIHWLFSNGYSDGDTSSDAVNAVRRICDVSSRSELKTRSDAREKFLTLVRKFEAEVKRGTVK